MHSIPWPHEDPHIPGVRMENGNLYGEIDGLEVAEGNKIKDFTLDPIPSLTIPDHIILRRYQQEGITKIHNILISHGAAFLADEMGLGKTFQAIGVMKVLFSTHKIKSARIVCPAGLIPTWQDALSQWDCKDVQVTSFNKANPQYPADLIITDEAHFLRGRQTQRSTTFTALRRRAKYALFLTGTPLYDRPRDLYKLLRIAYGNRFGSSREFDYRYCGGVIDDFGRVDNHGSSNQEELKQRLTHYMVRREAKDVLDELPPLKRIVEWCRAPDPVDQQFAERALRQLTIGAPTASAMMEAIKSTLAGKIPKVVEIAERNGGKPVLIFTWLKEHVHRIVAALETASIHSIPITGAIPTSKRADLLAHAIQHQYSVVATIDSLSTGVNLQHLTNIGIMHTIDYVPRKLLQAEKRIHRIGQSNGVIWYYPALEESVDRILVEKVVNKLSMSVVSETAVSEMRTDLSASDDQSILMKLFNAE